MRDIFVFYRLLNPEQMKAMEEVLRSREMTLESFKLLRKDYSELKSRVKKIEKKLLKVMQQAGNEAHVCNWITHEVASIENKYKDIDFAIKHYKIAMSAFDRTMNSPYLCDFDTHELYRGPVYNLKNHLSLADGRINNALDAIRITQRYFKNITSAFQSHEKLTLLRKQRDERLRLNEPRPLNPPQEI